jgi:uncharacterized protein YggE
MTIQIVLIGILASSSMGLAQAPDPCATAPQTCATLIETHATSEMRIPNTVVDVVVGVSASGKDLPEVQRALAEQSNKLLAYLKGQQVERLITTEVRFAPDTKSQKSGPEKTVGYNGNAKVSFRAKPDKVPDLLAGVLGNGANEIQSTTFTPTEEEIAAARRKLSEDATKTAIRQADAIATVAGLKVAAIRDINVDSDNFTGYMPRPGLAMYANAVTVSSGVVGVDTASGDSQLSIRVNVTAAATR